MVLFFSLPLLSHYPFFPDRSETESYLLQKQLLNEQKGSKESHHFKKELANQHLFMQGKKISQKTAPVLLKVVKGLLSSGYNKEQRSLQICVKSISINLSSLTEEEREDEEDNVYPKRKLQVTSF